MIEYSMENLLKTLKSHKFKNYIFDSEEDIIHFFFKNWEENYYKKHNKNFSENKTFLKHYKYYKQDDLKVSNKCILTSLKSAFPTIFNDDWLNIPLDIASNPKELLKEINTPELTLLTADNSTIKNALITQLREKRPCVLTYSLNNYGHAIACIGVSQKRFYFIENGSMDVTAYLLGIGLFLEMYRNNLNKYSIKLIKIYQELCSQKDKCNPDLIAKTFYPFIVRKERIDGKEVTSLPLKLFFKYSGYLNLIYLKDNYRIEKDTGEIVKEMDDLFSEKTTNYFLSLLKNI